MDYGTVDLIIKYFLKTAATSGRIIGECDFVCQEYLIWQVYKLMDSLKCKSDNRFQS
jgi:hypothetical protein